MLEETTLKSNGVVRSWHYRKGLIPPISGNALVLYRELPDFTFKFVYSCIVLRVLIYKEQKTKKCQTVMCIKL